MQHAIRKGDIPGVQLRYEKRFDLPPEELWRWLSEPERMKRWLAAEIEARAGAEEGWVLRDLDEAGGPLVEEMRSLAREGGRRWIAVFERKDDGWESATRLVVEIEGDGPCELSVLQQGFERLNLSRCLTVWEFYRRRWRAAFERLASAVEAAGADR